MIEYTGTTITPSLFLLHWTWVGWVVAFLFIVLLCTSLWRRIFRGIFIVNAIGWLCVAFAGLTGIWFIGWFAWVIPLSAMLFMRFIMEYRPEIKDDESIH
jgi:hypothetical protein